MSVRIKEVLQQLNLGNSVAEFDTELENYFVETETFRSLIDDKGDIIAGDKGTGKTALYKILIQRYQRIPALAKVAAVSRSGCSTSPGRRRKDRLPNGLSIQCVSCSSAIAGKDNTSQPSC